MEFDEEVNYADMEPEYDMEFVRYGPNPIELPLSPPGTPPPEDDEENGGRRFNRELSPFSESSSMTSVDSNESVGYYREEGGRMFPSMPDVPVVLPVDNAEIRRVSGQYNLVRLVTSEWHEEEMKEVLNPPYEATIKVLDVICNSPWIDDMAMEYPHAKFTGCNFVPTRHPHRSNIVLEVYNLNDGFRGKDQSFDLIHAFCTFKMTRDFRAWLLEMKRLLKPGGIIIIIDLEMAIWNRDGSDPWSNAPTMCSYVDRVFKGLASQGIDLTGMPLTGTWLREMDGFAEVEDTVTSIPVGDWEADELQKEIGIMARDNIVSVLFSTHPLWRRAGKSPEEIEQLVEAARMELFSGHQIFTRMFYTFARKEEAFEDDVGDFMMGD